MNATLIAESVVTGRPVAVLQTGFGEPQWACLDESRCAEIEAWLRRGLAHEPIRRVRVPVGPARQQLREVPILDSDPAYPQALADRLTYYSQSDQFRVRVTDAGSLPSVALQPLSDRLRGVEGNPFAGPVRLECGCGSTMPPWSEKCGSCNRPNGWAIALGRYRAQIDFVLAERVAGALVPSLFRDLANRLVGILERTALSTWPTPVPGMSLETYQGQVRDFIQLTFSLPGLDGAFTSDFNRAAKRIANDWMKGAIYFSRSIQILAGPSSPDLAAFHLHRAWLSEKASSVWRNAARTVSQLPKREALVFRLLRRLGPNPASEVQIPKPSMLGRLAAAFVHAWTSPTADPADALQNYAAATKQSRLDVCLELRNAEAAEASALSAMRRNLSDFVLAQAVAKFNALGEEAGRTATSALLKGLAIDTARQHPPRVAGSATDTGCPKCGAGEGTQQFLPTGKRTCLVCDYVR